MSRFGIVVALLSIVTVVSLVAFANDRHPVHATHTCLSHPGAFRLDSYEALTSGGNSWRSLYSRSMELAAHNQLVPDVPSFALDHAEVGSRSDGSANIDRAYIPPVLLKAIGWVESGWIQACPSVPYGTVGPVLVSHDYGYGIMQITTGMQNLTGVPTLDQVMIAGHYGFNIARGAQILMDKWNAAPEQRPVVGQRAQDRVESWYYALWDYNGFAFINHPLNPIFDPLRAPYRCDGTQNRGAYPYQELVFGCMKNPPVIFDVPLWDPVSATLPDLTNPAFTGPMSIANWEACAVHFACAPMDIPIPTPTHIDVTEPAASRAEVIGAPEISVLTEFEFFLTKGEVSNPRLVNVVNTGTGPLVWKLVRSDTWIKLSRANGVALGTDVGPLPSGFTFHVDTSEMEAGVHVGEIRIRSRMPNETKVIKVEVVVNIYTFIPGVIVN